MEETGTTQEQLAMFLGVSRQSVGYYADSSSLPSSEAAAKIAQYFSVSADWLLGLSDVRTPDVTIHGICDYTGLSEDNVAMLHDRWDFGDIDIRQVLNALLCKKEFVIGLVQIAHALSIPASYPRSTQETADSILYDAALNVALNAEDYYREHGLYVLPMRSAVEWNGTLAADYIKSAVKTVIDQEMQKYESGKDGD